MKGGNHKTLGRNLGGFIFVTEINEAIVEAVK